MTVSFEYLKIHHFMSFDDATISLKDAGFCLIEGVNECEADAAKSNGSGKSTIWNALSFALTGETLNGLKSNLANLAFDDGCWVEVSMTIDGKHVDILRSKDDSVLKTNLKIVVDGVDVSGKGVRDSQTLLSQMFPELTVELINSAIILGQGLPGRFTDNTPSGRKEVLEHLSKSDFMVEDIKNRLAKRSCELSAEVREADDSLLVLDTRKKSVGNEIASTESRLNDEKSFEVDNDELLAREALIDELNDEISYCQSRSEQLHAEVESARKTYDGVKEDKRNAIDKVKYEHYDRASSFKTRRMALKYDIDRLKEEIEHAKGVHDVCPTCGQRIPESMRIDTTELENELNESLAKMSVLDIEEKEDAQAYDGILNDINDEFDDRISEASAELGGKENMQKVVDNTLSSLIERKNGQSIQLASLRERKKSHDRTLNELNERLSNLTNELKSIEDEIGKANDRKTVLAGKIDVVSRMTTFVKRDFRGELLREVVDYIENKAKSYASKIFNTDDISFAIDGNDILIAFCGKDYENLSGGEKQRVDLIVQFALRDMMNAYSNFSCDMLVLDEITDALDSVSCDRVIDFIASEMQDIGSVFIISHHSDELSLPYDSIIKIRKNDKGISEVVS